jgi:putative transposase
MPGRKVPLIEGHFYHIINRGVGGIPIYKNKWNYKRFLNYLIYYQNINCPGRYSYFLNLPLKERGSILEELKQRKEFHVDLICYCLMPTHFHLLLKQSTKNGISKFLSQITNAYTRYFNSSFNRKGGLFQGKFKSVKIDNEEQLLHVSRYIHLNPYSGGLVKDFKSLIKYSYSSLPEYISAKGDMCQKKIILELFKTRNDYKKFVSDRANYQREIEFIKHLVLD